MPDGLGEARKHGTAGWHGNAEIGGALSVSGKFSLHIIAHQGSKALVLRLSQEYTDRIQRQRATLGLPSFIRSSCRVSTASTHLDCEVFPMRITRLFPLLAVPLLACLLLFLPAHAQSPVTDCSNDDELRADILVSHIITFTCGTATIALDAPIVIDKYIEIDGGNVITLTGMGVTHHFTVTGKGGLTLQDITLTDGNSAVSDLYDADLNPAGSIYNLGFLRLVRVTLLNNSSNAIWGVSGIYNGGNAEIIDSVLRDNVSTGYGVILNDWTLMIAVSQFLHNQGRFAGVLENHAQVGIGASDFRHNIATEGSGAIRQVGPRSRAAAISLNTLTFDDNSGESCGALQISEGSVSITSSTLSHNRSARGGVVCLSGRAGGAAVYVSTISGNQTNQAALSITENTGLALVGSTIVMNEAASGDTGGIYMTGMAALNVDSSILALNLPQDCLYESVVAGKVTHSVLGTERCKGSELWFSHSNVIGDPVIGPLADNGGHTLTHLPQPESPAINLGANQCTPFDQRNFPRNEFWCDAGSVEVEQRPVRQHLPLIEILDTYPTPTATPPPE